MNYKQLGNILTEKLNAMTFAGKVKAIKEYVKSKGVDYYDFNCKVNDNYGDYFAEVVEKKSIEDLYSICDSICEKIRG